jgi:hypothetical protein
MMKYHVTGTITGRSESARSGQATALGDRSPTVTAAALYHYEDRPSAP